MPDVLNNKVKRLPTQVFVGAYQSVTAASQIERQVTDEEWDKKSVICSNMAIATRDIAGCTNIRELGNPAALEAAASGAILGGLISGISQIMLGYSGRKSVRDMAVDPTSFEEEKNLKASKRPSIVAKVAEHNILKMDEISLNKVGSALTKGSSAIICIFDEILVKASDYENHMQDYRKEIDNLVDHVTSKIHQQLENGKDIAFHIVLDDDTGDISWTRTVVGEGAISVRDIVMSHDSLALEEVTTKDDGEVIKEKVVVTPESVASARATLRSSISEFQFLVEDLVDDNAQ